MATDYTSARRGQFSYWIPTRKINGEWRADCLICDKPKSMYIRTDGTIFCPFCGFTDIISGLVKEIKRQLEKRIAREHI